MIDDIKENIKFLEAILQFSMDSVSIIDESGLYRYRRDPMRPSLGWQPEELINTNIFTYIHEHDQALFKAALNKAISDKHAQLAAYRFKTKTGQWRWLECDIVNLLDFENIHGLIIRARDITAKVEADTREREHKAYYESLFFNNPDAIITLNGGGTIEDTNESMIRLFGYRKEEVIGKYFTSLIEPSFAELAREASEKSFLGQSDFFMCKAVCRGGDLLETRITLIPVLIDSRVLKVQAIIHDITEVVQANELLKEQARVQSGIFESINEAFFALDKDWRFSYVNKVCAAAFRKTKEELLNQSLTSVLSARYQNFANSEFLRNCKLVYNTGESIEFQEYFPLDKAMISFKVYPVADGIAVHFIDITAQVTALQEVEKLSFVASKVNNGVFILDNEGSMEWMNESFIKITGYTLAETRGSKVGDMILDIQATGMEIFSEIKNCVQRGLPFSDDVVLRNKNGQTRWVHADMTPVMGKSPEENKFYVILTDISDRKEAEEKLLNQADELFRQNRDLQQFAYIVSHNLRAPVANAIGLTQLLPGIDKNSPDFDEVVDKMQLSIKKLDGVITDINTILTERDKINLEDRKLVNILEICQQVEIVLHEAIQACGGSIVLEFEQGYNLYTSKAIAYSILFNLVSNAIKFRSPDRNLSIKIRSFLTRNGDLAVEVSDNGTGMDMERVGTKLFKLYSRFNSGIDGKGMGLFLVKTQVEALGGRIEVASIPDEGATFIIYFNPYDSKSIYY